MGVTGLWRLIEPAGKPVPVETLENKVLAVDISIWLHQMVKGYQDAKGAPLPNAHLMGLFQRLCKLLYFRIKPIFVFDGGFPELKKETIGKRQDNKAKYNSESERIKREIALLLSKKTAIGSLLGKQVLQKKNNTENNDDLFKLPALPEREQESESESEDEQSTSSSSIDLHSMDLESDKFKNLPVKDKYDLLVELKETRKMNSWGKLHTLPKQSDNFSDFQMQRLLKRRKLQECLQETEKEMGEEGMSLNDLESLLNDKGIDTKIESLPGRRIASNETTRYLLIKDVRQTLEEAKKKREAEAFKAAQTESTEIMITDTDVGNEKMTKNDELEDDLQKAIKMSLECVEEDDNQASTSKTDESWTSNLTDSDYSDSEDEDGFAQPDMSTAKAYIMQYSDFTHGAIKDIVSSKPKGKIKSKEPNLAKILEDLNKEKSIIKEMVDLSSCEEDLLSGNLPQTTGTSTSAVSTIVEDTPKLDTEKRDEVILLDTTVEDTENNIMEQNSSKENANQFVKLTSPDSEKELMSETEVTSDNEKEDMTNIEESLICVEEKDEVISLDTSTDEKANDTSKQIHSESSEDEFEEVPENKSEFKVPIVQLTLNLNETVEDDIFADVFDENKEVVNLDQISTTNKVDANEKKDIVKPTNEAPQQEVIGKINDTTNSKEIINVTSNNDNETHKASSNTEPIKATPIITTSEKPRAEIQMKSIQSNVELKEKLNTMVSEIEDQQQDLMQEKGKLDRIGRNITQQMTKEAQQLLQIFGIPYIIAPMEAEAQCAFLESIKLTDGTITDDSDIWLFGGQTVYKNFFNQKKHVLQYLSERIEKSFNLTREQLVLLALLVGSDYTTGINGVGPVTALEILASFPFNKKKLSNVDSKQARYQEMITGLIDFKKWVKAGKRTDNISLKKKLKNVSLTDDFPSVRVVQAYLDPNVEKSEEKFTWGKLDITILRDYTKAKFGWSQHKLDEIIKPVMKRMQDGKNQKTVHDYFKRKIDFQSLEDQMSKRVKAAVNKMGPSGPIEDVQNDGQNKEKKVVRKRKANSKNEGMGPSGSKKRNSDNIKAIHQVVNTLEMKDNEQKFDINVKKNQTFQEIIPQREKDRQNMLENKLKAIETFRKSKIDKKKRPVKRRLPKPKENADLSESSDSN